MGSGVDIGKMSKTIMKELKNYGIEVGLEVDKVCKDVAAETAKTIAKNAPERTGQYVESWTYGKGETKRTRHTLYVHAEDPGYRLAHLLEKGHQLIRGGRKIGESPAIEHIATAEKEMIAKLEKELRKRL